MKANATLPRVGQRRALVFAAALVVFAPAASLACGACVEDKIAATYDHGVVERAAASGKVMVFCEVIGPLDAKHLNAVMRRVRGVKPQSVRVSVQLAAMSFAVDPTVRSPQDAVETAQHSMASGTRLRILRLQSQTNPSL
jgi:hypothetical protein